MRIYKYAITAAASLKYQFKLVSSIVPGVGVDLYVEIWIWPDGYQPPCWQFDISIELHIRVISLCIKRQILLHVCREYRVDLLDLSPDKVYPIVSGYSKELRTLLNCQSYFLNTNSHWQGLHQ